MTRVRVSAASLAAAVMSIAATTPVSAQDNTWFQSVWSASVSASPAAEGRQPAVKKLVAFTKRPAPEKTIEREADEPRSTSLTGGGITWQAASSCAPAALRSVLADLVGNFGPVTVTSTCRGRSQNRAAGGADHSYHLTGEAVDFRVSGSASAVQAFLADSGKVGGLKHYGGGLYHIDTGPRRSW
jgi:Peptidase M15